MSKAKLSDEQKQLILDEWNSRPDNPPSLLELVKSAFPKLEEADGRSKEGRAVKAFLASRKLKARGAQDYQAKGVLELSEEQEEYIINNASLSKPVEMARVLFKDNKITNLHQETRTIIDFLKTANVKVYTDTVQDVVVEYRAPNTFFATLTLVNKYIHVKLNKDKLMASQRKELDAMTGYLHTYRFLHQINTYAGQTDRDLFESSFVRYTNDKADLTQEEVDQYIVLCTEVVISSSIQGTIQMLQRQIDDQMVNGDRIPMTIIEASNTARTEYNQCVQRQQKLLNDLKVKRSDRLSKQIKENASILNLVQLWKEEDSRKKLIKLGEIRKKALSDEISNLSSMDEVKARILGLSDDEVLNG